MRYGYCLINLKIYLFEFIIVINKLMLGSLRLKETLERNLALVVNKIL